MKANCVVCGKEFEKKKHNTMMCSQQCRKARQAELARIKYARNPEKQKEANRRWQSKDPERARELHRKSVRRRYEANPEKYLESRERWRQANPQKWSESQQRWRQANRKKVKIRARRYRARKALGLPPLIYDAFMIMYHFSQQKDGTHVPDQRSRTDH